MQGRLTCNAVRTIGTLSGSLPDTEGLTVPDGRTPGVGQPIPIHISVGPLRDVREGEAEAAQGCSTKCMAGEVKFCPLSAARASCHL